MPSAECLLKNWKYVLSSIFAIGNRSINLSKVTGTNGFLLNTPLVKIHLNIANGKLKVKLQCHLGKHYLVDQGRRVVFVSGWTCGDVGL